MSKPAVIAKIQFIGKGKQQISKLSGLAKYYQYRDGSLRRDAFAHATPEDRAAGSGYPAGLSDHVKPENRDIKWVDRGMGETYRSITRRAVELAGRRTTARMWIIAPDPELMQFVPPERRMAVLQQVTEKTMHYLYDDNGWGNPEFSYVMHDKQRNQDGLQMLHTHVITPGTYDGGEGVGRLDHVLRRPHLRNLHDISHEVLLGEMERELGRERTADILREREEKLRHEKDPDARGRQQRRERAERRDNMTRFNDLWSLLEQDRQAEKHKKQSKTRKRQEADRADALRRYFQIQRRDVRADQEQGYAAVQAEWERKRTTWHQEHQSELQAARAEDRRRQQLQAKEQHEAERAELRAEHISALRKQWGWQAAQLLGFFSDRDLADMAGAQPAVPEPALELD